MKHIHSVYDTDSHFSISPITRAIKNESSKKTTVMQYDHNSERFTFEMPREIEGHDMTLCNRVKLHYINVASDKSGQSKSFYVIDDLQISQEDESVVICSWLISRNATMYAGSLNFLLCFECLSDEGDVTYAWNTDIFKGISVSNGIFNDVEEVIEPYNDVLVQWKNDIYNTHEQWKSEIGETIDSHAEQIQEHDGILEAYNDRMTTLEDANTETIEALAQFDSKIEDKVDKVDFDIEASDFKASEYVNDAWNKIIASKQYVVDRHQSALHTIKDLEDTIGWYKIAERAQTYTSTGMANGEGRCANIFRLHCFVNGQGEADIIFAVTQAEWNAVPSISILNYSYRTNKVVTDIRVVYPSSSATKTSIAYIEVYVDKKSTSNKIQFRVEALLHDSVRKWIVKSPAFDTSVKNDDYAQGKVSGWKAYSKSAIDHAWSDVTLPTPYINTIPVTLATLEANLGNLGTRFDTLEAKIDEMFVREWFELAYYDGENGISRKSLIMANAIKFKVSFSYYGYYITFEFIPEEQPDIDSFNNCKIDLNTIRAYRDLNFGNYGEEVIIDAIEGGYATISVGDNCNGVDGYAQVGVWSDLVLTIGGDTLRFEDNQPYYEYDESDGWSEGGLHSCQAYVEKNKDTVSLFPTTYDFRAQSVYNRLKANLEEAIAKRRAERENTEE